MVIHTTPESSVTDVLVIGAGPAGLMAALALSRLDVNVKIIDRRCVVHLTKWENRRLR